jgi:uncharacterized coiled-coil DUF342 family protein
MDSLKAETEGLKSQFLESLEKSKRQNDAARHSNLQLLELKNSLAKIIDYRV